MPIDYPNEGPGTQRIVLASGSPRRVQLLALLIQDFQVVVPEVDEGRPAVPQDLLIAARRKAEAAQGEGDIVIGADTGVFLSGRHFGKPVDLAQAREFLLALSGRWHEVYTGVCVLGPAGAGTALVSTRVKFSPLTDEEIEWYLANEEVLDKAGAYAIQGRAGAFVERIEGDFFNVMGFPLYTVYRLLRGQGWRPGP